MTKTLSLVVALLLCMACCARRLRKEPNTEGEQLYPAVPQAGQVPAGNLWNTSSRDARVTRPWENEPVEEAVKNLRRARKAVSKHLVAARNNYAMEVLHNRSVLLRNILNKQRAEEPAADC